MFLEPYNELLSDITGKKKKKGTSLERSLTEHEKWKFIPGTQRRAEHLCYTACQIMHALPPQGHRGERSASAWRMAPKGGSPVVSGSLAIHPGDKRRPRDESQNPLSPPHPSRGVVTTEEVSRQHLSVV